MAKKLDLAAVFRNDAADLHAARERAFAAHPSDIRAAGNEVENAVRDWLRNILPRKYHVTHGHLIDRERQVSPELDIIIADNEFLPSLLRMADGTEYVPAEAAYAVAEIKSTYSYAKRHLADFCNKLKDISEILSRPEVLNTAKDGIRQGTLMKDIVRGSSATVHNRLFSFMLCIDAGDYQLESARAEMTSFDRRCCPGVVALLNRGILVAGRMDGKFNYTRYPGTGELAEAPHVLIQPAQGPTGSLDGGVLGFLYATVVDHLNISHIEPFPAAPYLSELLMISRKGSEGL